MILIARNFYLLCIISGIANWHKLLGNILFYLIEKTFVSIPSSRLLTCMQDQKYDSQSPAFLGIPPEQELQLFIKSIIVFE